MTAPLVELPADPDARELRQLLDEIHDRYGLDFRDYAYSSLKRRVLKVVQEEKAGSIAALRMLVRADTAAMERLKLGLTVHVTAMFRDPAFFRTFREEVSSALGTYPFLRIWVAGCSTGEEVYSLAILLHEEGLYPRCRIYATDVSDTALNRARAGIYPLAAMQEYTRNYQRAGGHHSFAEYYTADSEHAIFRPFLKENVVFAAHNLAGDASFNEFQAIFCRNVMIYFNRTLQARAHALFYESLPVYGYFALGRSETMRFTPFERCYEAVNARERLYRKIR